MESKEKLRVLLQHWIEHNDSHVEEFDKWRQTAAGDGLESIAAHIATAILEMKQANEALAKALAEAGGAPEAHGDHHHHHHHHH